MKRLLIAMLLIGAHAISFSYDKEIMILPDSGKTVSAYITDDKEVNFFVRCISDLTVTCDNFVQVEPGKESRLNININADKRGRHKVSVRVGGEGFEFDVIVSDQVQFFINELNEYELLFTRLESKYGESPLLENGMTLIESGKYLYSQSDFMSIAGILDDLQKTLSDYYETVGIPVEVERTQLGFSIIPILVVGGLLGFYHYRNWRKKTPPDAHGLEELVEKELGGLKVG